MSFFHGVTTTSVDTGARTISLPSSSIIGLCDTFTPGVLGGGTAKAGELKLITTEREAIAAFGADSAITKACQAIYVKAKAVDNYDDAVLFRQEVANLFAGFIKRPSPDSGPAPRDPVTGALLDLDRDGFTPMVALEPGTMQELGPGEEVEFSKPPDAGNNYPDFMRQQLMAAAAGSGTPYEILTGDMRGINDRALRVVGVATQRLSTS